MLPQVLLTGAEHLLRRSLSQGAQGATHLLLHQRVLVGDGVQQDGGQLCNDKAQRVRSGPARPASHRLGLPPQDAGPLAPLHVPAASATAPPTLPASTIHPRGAASHPLAHRGLLGTHGLSAPRALWQPHPDLTPQALTAPRLLPPRTAAAINAGATGSGPGAKLPRLGAAQAPSGSRRRRPMPGAPACCPRGPTLTLHIGLGHLAPASPTACADSFFPNLEEAKHRG